MNNNIVLECNNVTKFYREAKDKLEVLRGINLEVAAGEQIAIIGRSGSGKTTLLQLLGGLDLPYSGKIEFLNADWQDISESKRARLRNTGMGFIYQMHHLLPEFSALENVAIPLMLRKHSLKEIKKLAEDMLKVVGLDTRLQHKPAELSGGERQRVAIARALVTKPKCVLADELTGNLDYDTARTIFDLIFKLSKEYGIAFVVVTHDLELAGRLDKQYKLVGGRLEC